MAGRSLTPFVYWAQTSENISLRIDLAGVNKPSVQVDGKNLTFKAVGAGAQGEQEYNFTVEFFGPIDEKECALRVLDRQVELNIKKVGTGEKWWPRLTSQSGKLTWLKVDFDKWRSESDEEEDKSEAQNAGMENFDFKSMQQEHMHNLPFNKRLEEFESMMSDLPIFKARTWYLFFYNLIQMSCFVVMLVQIIYRWIRDGKDSIPGTYEAIGQQMVIALLATNLQIVHVLVGYVKSPLLPVAMLVLQRFLIVVLLIVPEPRMQTKPVIFVMFAIWSFGEIFRYPFYMLAVLKKEVSVITWLRYTVPLVCVPIGFICEGIVMLRSVVYLQETDRWTFTFPEPLQFLTVKFQYLVILQMLLSIPGILVIMKTIYSQRRKKIMGGAKLKVR